MTLQSFGGPGGEVGALAGDALAVVSPLATAGGTGGASFEHATTSAVHTTKRFGVTIRW
jgi:hypothetical protein